jgi:hypothetical protein
LPLKNKTNQFFLPFICFRLGRSRIGKERKEKARKKSKRKGEREK